MSESKTALALLLMTCSLVAVLIAQDARATGGMDSYRAYLVASTAFLAIGGLLVLQVIL